MEEEEKNNKESNLIRILATIGALGALALVIFYTPLFSFIYFGDKGLDVSITTIFIAILFSPLWILIAALIFFIFFAIRKTRKYKLEQSVTSGESKGKGELFLWWSILTVILIGLIYLWLNW